MPEHNRRLPIDRHLFEMAFGRDVDYSTEAPQRTHLDLHTGEIVWTYETDDDAYMEAGIPTDGNRRERERVAGSPGRFLEIPGLDHGDHHDILKAFLYSDWTGDEGRRRAAEDAYFGSIGGWKNRVGDRDTIDAFYAFQEKRILELAEAFLRENGIAPIWR